MSEPISQTYPGAGFVEIQGVDEYDRMPDGSARHAHDSYMYAVRVDSADGRPGLDMQPVWQFALNAGITQEMAAAQLAAHHVAHGRSVKVVRQRIVRTVEYGPLEEVPQL